MNRCMKAVVAKYPAYSAAWAALAERAYAAADPVTAYAFARTGYHRGLDQLRRHPRARRLTARVEGFARNTPAQPWAPPTCRWPETRQLAMLLFRRIEHIGHLRPSARSIWARWRVGCREATHSAPLKPNPPSSRRTGRPRGCS